MNIAIIGGGSIGLLVSSYLAERHQVTLYVRRNQQRNKVNSQQITLINNELKFQTRNIVAKLSEDFSSHVDLCIVCVKQAQVDEVLIMLASIDKHVPILFLQNGMGHIDKLQAIANPVSVGVVNHGAHKMADDVVHHLGKGTIEIASLTENEYQLKKLIMTLEDKSFPIVYKQSWTSILKEKLIVNAVINPLTALFDVPNGEVVSNNHLNFLAKKICQETAAVLELSEVSRASDKTPPRCSPSPPY